MKAIAIRPYVGVGDGLQFSSVPENYFRATGEKLIDVDKPWFFDHNPYVVRNVEALESETTQLWNFGPQQYPWPRPRKQGVYLCNAEAHAAAMKVPMTLGRPRLYRYEDFPFEKRSLILFHPYGRSNGAMPDHIIDHVLKKYKGSDLFQIGFPDDPDLGIEKIPTPTLWELAHVCSTARMLIGVDSGPSWVAACYPDVVIKKVRVKMPDGFPPLKEWVPLEIDNYHSHWDDRLFSIHNTTEDDVGFTQSYKRI